MAAHCVKQTDPSLYADVDEKHFKGEVLKRVSLRLTAQPGSFDGGRSVVATDANDNIVEVIFLGQREADFAQGVGAHLDGLETAYGYARMNGNARGMKRGVDAVVVGTLRPARAPDGDGGQRLIWRLIAARWTYRTSDGSEVPGGQLPNPC